jgi:two-component system response regulator FlrC
VIDEQKAKFAVASELAGRLIRVDLASGQSDAYGFEAVISLIALQKHMAVGAQSSMAMYGLAQRVARSDVTVFINGPTGTGKEVLAKFVHLNSTRADKPFVAVNCAAIPENMLEAILFGHEKGSFTGASTANKGIFRAADGGTLLLDEISEMPMSLQAKLLRALQEKTVTPIGGHEDIPVDVRVLATTNRDMPKAIRDGVFREDLYYRLNVFPLTTLPLVARPEDIIPIASALLVRHCDGQLDNLPALSDAAVKALTGYEWPGNVRELENVLQRALVLCQDNIIQAHDIITDMQVGDLYQSHAQRQPSLAAVNS